MESALHRIADHMPETVRLLLDKHRDDLSFVTELRLRRGKPLCVCFGNKIAYLGDCGICSADRGLVVTDALMDEAWRLVTASSVYALEEELRRGYITLKGGHRVGIAGSAVLRDEKVKTQKDICSLNYRFAREVKGIGETLLPFLCPRGVFENTLIYSPPGAGKTTLLRDLVRILSCGSKFLPPQNISVVDERGEIAGTYMGHPCYDLGDNTDVLHGFPKREGMTLALRSLGPQILATDEIGTEEDRIAIEDAVRCGVDLLLTAHAGSLEELKTRPILQRLLREGVFLRLVELSAFPEAGTVTGVYMRKQTEGMFDYVESDPVFSCNHRRGAGRIASCFGAETASL
ncbi:MAG: stage III sporulation protein AA [Firmicutes bacterium]|nr:stage III sporulation protein AA [Bacillota bacterium]